MADKGLDVPRHFGDWADRLRGRGPAFALRFGPAGDDEDENARGGLNYAWFPGTLNSEL
jgi:hypothetical protein